MKHYTTGLVFGLFLLLSAAEAIAGIETPGFRRINSPTSGSYSIRYLPASVDQSQPAPVIVFLHGSGSSPEFWQDILSPLADDLGFVLLLPKSDEFLGFGPGKDEETIRETLDILGETILLDESRISIAGHSAGGAYAIVLGLQARSRFSGIFSLSSPYRIVLSLGDPAYTPPVRMYYGTDDPNYQGGSRSALVDQMQRLGVPLTEEIRDGFGHNTWPDTTFPDGFSFLLSQSYRTAWDCIPSRQRLCLNKGRFAVEATWRDFQDNTGTAQAVPLGSDDSGMLWFFRDNNWEVLVKVIDACSGPGRYWVLGSASTNVEYTLSVTDMSTGQTETYFNPLGNNSAAITDTSSFATCP